MSDDFQIAYERARRRIGEEAWDVLTTHEQATAIYEELRALDIERDRKKAPPDQASSYPRMNTQKLRVPEIPSEILSCKSEDNFLCQGLGSGPWSESIRVHPC
jgi:hypothetical protein